MSKSNLDACIRDSMQTYFKDLGGEQPHSVYDMFIKTVEKPMLEAVMQQADNNQSRAAAWLDLNRNTLRKKLQEHNLL